MKRLFKRASGQEQCAKCPVCGKYMEKETCIVLSSSLLSFLDRLHSARHLHIWYCRDCNESMRP
jgi:hypothetical protein